LQFVIPTVARSRFTTIPECDPQKISGTALVITGVCAAAEQIDRGVAFDVNAVGGVIGDRDLIDRHRRIP
jgi:hypothetical protein